MKDRNQQAREKGRKAFKDGKRTEDNPYLTLSHYKILASHWDAGFIEAKTQLNQEATS